MRVADQHRPGAEQVIDVFLPILVPYPAALALADDNLAGEIPERAARQDALRGLEDIVLDRVHFRSPRLILDGLIDCSYNVAIQKGALWRRIRLCVPASTGRSRSGLPRCWARWGCPYPTQFGSCWCA